jgi:hypothetical protein
MAGNLQELVGQFKISTASNGNLKDITKQIASKKIKKAA